MINFVLFILELLNMKKTSEEKEILLFPLHLFSQLEAKIKPHLLIFQTIFKPDLHPKIYALYQQATHLDNTTVTILVYHIRFRFTE